MATSTHLRHINQRKVIRAMLQLRSASRAQLARAAGLSQPTVGRIVTEMLADSLLAPEGGCDDTVPGNGQKQLGRPSERIALDRRRRRFLAIHVGVHETRLRTVPMAVSQADQWDQSFPTPPSAERWAQATLKTWTRLEVRGIEAIVLSLPGVVDERVGRVLLSPNLHWTEGVDFAELLRPIHRRAAVLCVQEIRALALGQLMAEPQRQDFLLVDFGTGVGAAAVISGKLFESPLPLSGELGHTPVFGNRRRCSCGGTGCVETLISRNGIVQTSTMNGGADQWPALLEDLRKNGLPPWLLPSLEAVATTIAGALNVLGLRHVVLTGELSTIAGAAEYFQQAITRDAMWGRFGQISCEAVRRRRLEGIASIAIDHTFLAEEH